MSDQLAQVYEPLTGMGGMAALWLVRRFTRPTATVEFWAILVGQVLYVAGLATGLWVVMP
jgi:hypothetical protein